MLSSTVGFEGNGCGAIVSGRASRCPAPTNRRTYDLDGLGNWRKTVFTPEGGMPETEVRQHNGLNEITGTTKRSDNKSISLTMESPGHSNGNGGQ